MKNEKTKEAAVIRLEMAETNDTTCLMCGLEIIIVAYVGQCPKCGGFRWYRCHEELKSQK